MKTLKTSQDIGIIVDDINLLNANSSEMARIKTLTYSHKIVIIKNQALNEKQLCDLSFRLGNPVPYLQENYHHPEYPLIFVSSNVKQNGKKIGVARTGGYWHSDTSFLKNPIPLTLLYPQIIPKNSQRTTRFIDLEKAFNAMPQKLKQRLETMTFIHSGKWKYKVRPEDVGLDLSEILALIQKVQPPVAHPAVITHPITGKKMLYVSRGFTVGVENMPTDEARALLSEVFDFIEQECFVSEFQWHLGDLILWDNRFLSHKAGRLSSLVNNPQFGKVNTEEDTMMYRIIIKDDYPLSLKKQEYAKQAA